MTAGGVPLSALDAGARGAQRGPVLFLCGELCDVDGRIGGFNFQWAWASGTRRGARGGRAGSRSDGGTCVTMTHPMIGRATAGCVLVAVLALVVASRATRGANAGGRALLWQGRLGAHRRVAVRHHPCARRAGARPARRRSRSAFDRADRVVTEIPLDASQQAELAAALLLPEGQRLRAIIGEALFARLEARVRAALDADRARGGPAGGGHARPTEAVGRDGATGHARVPAGPAGGPHLARRAAVRRCRRRRQEGRRPRNRGRAGRHVRRVQPAGTGRRCSTRPCATSRRRRARPARSWWSGTSKEMVRSWPRPSSQGSGDAALARKFEAEVLVKRNHRMADRIDALRRDAPGRDGVRRRRRAAPGRQRQPPAAAAGSRVRDQPGAALSRRRTKEDVGMRFSSLLMAMVLVGGLLGHTRVGGADPARGCPARRPARHGARDRRTASPITEDDVRKSAGLEIAAPRGAALPAAQAAGRRARRPAPARSRGRPPRPVGRGTGAGRDHRQGRRASPSRRSMPSSRRIAPASAAT